MRAFCVSGYRKSGKTTLICQLIERYRKQGLKVGLLKHSHCPVKDVLKEVSDTGRYQAVGAETVALKTPAGLSFIPSQKAFNDEDIIILEGFKKLPLPKILTAVNLPTVNKEDFTQIALVYGAAAFPDGTPVFKQGEEDLIAAAILPLSKMLLPVDLTMFCQMIKEYN